MTAWVAIFRVLPIFSTCRENKAIVQMSRFCLQNRLRDLTAEALRPSPSHLAVCHLSQRVRARTGQDA